jgi:hypothetical protein
LIFFFLPSSFCFICIQALFAISFRVVSFPAFFLWHYYVHCNCPPENDNHLVREIVSGVGDTGGGTANSEVDRVSFFSVLISRVLTSMVERSSLWMFPSEGFKKLNL